MVVSSLDRRERPFEVVRPVALARRDLVVQLAERGDLVVRHGSVRGHDPVAVALLVPGAQRERALQPGAGEVVAEDVPPLVEQLGEQLVEIGVRRPRHGLTVGGAMLRK